MPSNVPTAFTDLLAGCTHSGVHLEMRDSYAVDCERGPFADWRARHRHNPRDWSSWWRPWLDLVQHAVNRGVTIRRARIVSEPVSEYTRFLYDGTFTNIAAGERISWLPRRHASDIALGERLLAARRPDHPLEPLRRRRFVPRGRSLGRRPRYGETLR
jgi:hypothetical protein